MTEGLKKEPLNFRNNGSRECHKWSKDNIYV